MTGAAERQTGVDEVGTDVPGIENKNHQRLMASSTGGASGPLAVAPCAVDMILVVDNHTLADDLDLGQGGRSPVLSGSVGDGGHGQSRYERLGNMGSGLPTVLDGRKGNVRTHRKIRGNGKSGAIWRPKATRNQSKCG